MVEASFFTRGHYDHPDNIRARRETRGGALYDIGVYNISLAQYLFGREPEKVQAAAHFMPSGVDDFSTETLDFGDGRLAALTSGMCSHFARFSNFRVMGDAGWIDAPIEYNACGAQSFTLRRADGTSETVRKSRDFLSQNPNGRLSEQLHARNRTVRPRDYGKRSAAGIGSVFARRRAHGRSRAGADRLLR